MILENLLTRDDAGWNFNRFVKTRRNTGGRGAPPVTMESIAINDGRLIVTDRGRLVETKRDGDAERVTFAYIDSAPGDVVVTDGYTGNIALKTAEGTAKQIGEYLRAAMRRSPRPRHAPRAALRRHTR